MQTNNSSLEKFKRANGGYMLRDISKPHKILTIHAELQINEDHSKNPYYHNVTKRDISTAPLFLYFLDIVLLESFVSYIFI